MLSNSLKLNIILLNCENNELNFIEDNLFKDERPIIIIVKKYGRYFPLMSYSGCIFNVEENEILIFLRKLV